jgi:hypothetical protein
VVAIANFSAAEIAKAETVRENYSAALVFSTKYDPPRLLFNLGRRNEEFDRKYFGFHRDLPPGLIARMLDGQLVWGEERKGQWAAVMRFSRAPGASEASYSARARSSATPLDSR